MSRDFDLTEYLSTSLRKMGTDLARTAAKHPALISFLAQFPKSAHSAQTKRREHREKGVMVPAFIAASIAPESSGGSTDRADRAGREMLPVSKWNEIFRQAEGLGISFIFLIGSEPFRREKVLDMAAKHKKILFLAVTDARYLQKQQLKFLKASRNIIPILKGTGASETMDALAKAGVIFGVYTDNFSEDMVDPLKAKGCRGLLYAGTDPACISSLRDVRGRREDMIFVTLPGDVQAEGPAPEHGADASAECPPDGHAPEHGIFFIDPYGFAGPFTDSHHIETDLTGITLGDAFAGQKE